MRVYSRENKTGILTYCWIRDRVVGCIFPDRAALGAALSGLSVAENVRVIYEAPPDIERSNVHWLSVDAFRAVVAGECAQAAEPVPRSVPEFPAGYLEQFLAEIHEELDNCLDDHDWTRAGQIARRLTHVRREFEAA